MTKPILALSGLFSTSEFPPRWRCGNWLEWHGWLHIISDILIGFAYLAIPAVLVFFLSRRRDIPFPKILILFAAFIFACGSGHFIEALIFWHPVYYFAGTVKAITATVSWATVFALIPLVPRVLNLNQILVSHEQLRQITRDLERSNAELSELGMVIAHQLKGPLRGVHNYSEIVRREAKDRLTEEEQDRLSTVSALAQRLDLHLTTLLQFANVRQRRTFKRNTDLQQVVREIHSALAPELEERHASFQLATPLPVVYCDPEQTRDAISHILGFSLAMGKEAPFSLSMSCENQDAGSKGKSYLDLFPGRWLFRVTRSGHGLSAREADTVLQMFGYEGQVEKADLRTQGMAFAKRLLDNQEEHIWIESEEGGDTSFFFTIEKGNTSRT